MFSNPDPMKDHITAYNEQIANSSVGRSNTHPTPTIFNVYVHLLPFRWFQLKTAFEGVSYGILNVICLLKCFNYLVEVLIYIINDVFEFFDPGITILFQSSVSIEMIRKRSLLWMDCVK